MNPSAPHADSGEVVARHMNDTPARRDPEAVDELIARGLRRAHQTAGDFDAPTKARAILHVAHSFADELATTNPCFDRLRFIRAATEHP